MPEVEDVIIGVDRYGFGHCIAHMKLRGSHA